MKILWFKPPSARFWPAGAVRPLRYWPAGACQSSSFPVEVVTLEDLPRRSSSTSRSHKPLVARRTYPFTITHWTDSLVAQGRSAGSPSTSPSSPLVPPVHHDASHESSQGRSAGSPSTPSRSSQLPLSQKPSQSIESRPDVPSNFTAERHPMDVIYDLVEDHNGAILGVELWDRARAAGLSFGVFRLHFDTWCQLGGLVKHGDWVHTIEHVRPQHGRPHAGG